MAQHSGTLAYARQKEIEDQVRSGAIATVKAKEALLDDAIAKIAELEARLTALEPATPDEPVEGGA